MRSKMNTVFYRCLATGLTVDEWVGDIPHNDKATAFYEAITCRACNRIHLINLSTGKVRRQRPRGYTMSAMTPMRLQKSIYWIIQWGWRGPAFLAFAVFCLWLYEMLKY